MNIGRNEKCPCGSGKKFKKCYMLKDVSCKIYAQENKNLILSEHNRKEKEVFKFFTEAVEDIQKIFLADGCERIVSPRIQLICAFTLAEVFASYWNEYAGQTDLNLGPKDRFIEWFNKFCSVNTNETYEKLTDFKILEPIDYYNFRSSLAHFLGMSPQKMTSKYIVIGSSNMDEKTFNNFCNGFKKKDKNTAVFKPIDFYNLFKDAGKLMLEFMGENINKSGIDESRKMAHVCGIDRIFNKFLLEGAIQFKIKKLT